MRHFFTVQLSALLLAAMASGVHADVSGEASQSAGNPPSEGATLPGIGQEPATPSALSPGITVTGTTPHDPQPLPKLPPDQFTDCYSASRTAGPETMDFVAMALCERQLERDRRTVIEKCINRTGKNAPPVVIQACTELLEHRIFIGSERYYVYVNRAEAYLFQGDRQHALDDYNEAVTLAPHNAKLRYNRGVFYLGQPDIDAALRDFDAALGLDPKLVAALLQRARIHKTREEYSGALADYSEAIRLEPKMAAYWSERGVVNLLAHDYENAVADETQAIQLEPKQARAYFYRAAALGELGESSRAHADTVTAVRLDPALGRLLKSGQGGPPAATAH